MTIARVLRQLLYTFLAVTLLKGCTPLLADAPADVWVTLDVSPRISAGPTSIRFSVTTPKDARNRSLCFGYDGTQFRSSCQEFVGLGAAGHVEQAFRDVPPGVYVAFAELTRDEGEKGKRSRVVTMKFVICGEGVGCDPEGGVAEAP